MIVAMTSGASGLGGPLEAALAEASGARGLRYVKALSAEIDGLAATPDTARLDTLAARARAMLSIETLAASEPAGDGAASTMERFVTDQQIAWPVAREVMTSLAQVSLPAEVGRGLLAIVAELVAMVQAGATENGRVRLFLASEPEDGGLVFAFAAAGVDDAPVPTAGAARALRRAERLTALIGGSLVRGFRDGMLIVGVTLALAEAI